MSLVSEEAEDLRLKAAIDAVDAEINTLKVGDVVKLKSGGPDLTVDMVRDDGVVHVAWFMGASAMEHAFPRDMLEKVPPPHLSNQRGSLVQQMAERLYGRAKAQGRKFHDVYRESVFFDPAAA